MAILKVIDAYQAQKKGEQEQSGKADEPRIKWWPRYNPTNLFSAMLALFTFALVITTVATLYIDQRPYISATVTGLQVYKVGQVSVAGLQFVNHGKTPADNVIMKTFILVEKSGWPLPWSVFKTKQKDLARSSLSIMPGETYTTVSPALDPLGQNVPGLIEANDPKYRLLVLTDIEYVDLFWQVNHLRFCSFYNPNDRNFSFCSSSTVVP